MNLSKNLSPKTYHLKPTRGFTIVELIVVIAIIGIVTSIIMASISNAKAKGRDSKRIADISVIQLALENYYDQHHNYPSGNSYQSLLSALGDSSLPSSDPSGNSYQYYSLDVKNENICPSNCQSYHLGTTLELDNGILSDDTVDVDNGVGFVGADTVGCGGGTGKCYDVVAKF